MSAIAIDSQDPDTVYIDTGDDDAGDTSSIEMLKSTNGGASFETTSLTFTEADANISEIYIDPTARNHLFISSNKSYSFEEEALVTLNDKSSNVLWERGRLNGSLLRNASKGYQVYATNLGGNYTNLTLAFIHSLL